MDKDTKKNIRLGLFVTLGIILFIIGIFLVGSKTDMFKKTFTISAVFDDVNGLKTGSKVRFNGVNSGIVKAVTLVNDSTVQVDMQIEDGKRQFLRKNSIAKIESDGLMGDKMVVIENGIAGGKPIEDKDFIKTKSQINVDKVLATLSASNDNVRIISENLKDFTNDLNTGKGALQALYKDPEMANSLKQSFNNLQAMSHDVLQVSQGLRQITSQVQHGHGALGEMLNDTTMGKNLIYTANKLKATSDKLNTVSGQLSKTMDYVNSGNGTVNTLLTDSSLAHNLSQSVVNINAAAKTLNEDLEGMKHSILLRGFFRKKAKEQK